MATACISQFPERLSAGPGTMSTTCATEASLYTTPYKPHLNQVGVEEAQRKLSQQLDELCQAIIILSRKPELEEPLQSSDHTPPAKSTTPDEEQPLLPERKQSPPDGGWGWLVVGSTFYINFMLAGLIRSYGVVLLAISDHFPTAPTSLVTWIPGVMGTVSLVFSPASSFLCDRFGCRRVVFVGGLLTAVGTSLCYFLLSVPYLIFAGGFITGLGFTLCITPCILIVGLYFERHRALANSLSSGGSALGGLIMPHIMRTSLEALGLQWTFAVLGGLMLTICAAACLLSPLDRKTRRESSHKSVRDNLDLMYNPVFAVLLASVVFMSAGSPHVLYFLPAYAEHCGLAKISAGSLLSYAAFGDLSGRVVFGWASDKKFLPRRVEYVCSVALAAVAVLVLPRLDTFWSLSIFSVVYGATTGSWQCLIPVLLADKHGTDKLGGAISLIRMFQGITNLAIPPITGYLKDVNGHFLTGFYLMGSFMTVSAIVALLMPLAEAVERKRYSDDDDPT